MHPDLNSSLNNINPNKRGLMNEEQKKELGAMSADLLHMSTQRNALNGNLAALSRSKETTVAQLNAAAMASKEMEYNIAVKAGLIDQWIQHFAEIEAGEKFAEMLNPPEK